MKLNKNQLDKINKANQFIMEWCDYFTDNEEELIFSEDRITDIIEQGEDIDTINFLFGGEDDYTYIKTEEYLNLCDEIESIEIINNGHIKTKLRSYYIVKANDLNSDYIIREHENLFINKTEDISLNIVTDSPVVGLAATKLEEYEDDAWGTVSQYLTVEIIYQAKDKIPTPEEEKELVAAYLFEIADSTGHGLSFSEIRNQASCFYDLVEKIEENLSRDLRNLEPFNEGMTLFVSAVQIEDSELKFLNFYKVLELFSPVASSIEANELMRKKLDAPKSSFENGDYIKSIFDLANSMRDRLNDEDLIKTSFKICFDFVGLYKKLPQSIKKKIKKHLQIQDLTYSTDEQKLASARNIAGKIIYKTRNKVVHAKSNFTLTGDEVTSDELPELNDFMKEASSQAIRWYSRLPNHLKLSAIK